MVLAIRQELFGTPSIKRLWTCSAATTPHSTASPTTQDHQRLKENNRKLIITGMALAMLAIPAVASADVPRCEAPVTSTTTATFTVTQPYNGPGSWESGVWTHDYTVTVQRNGSFAGTGPVYGPDGPGGPDAFVENVTGTSNADGTISLRATRATNVLDEFSLDHARTDGTETLGTTVPVVSYAIEMKVTPLVFSATTTDGLNHGQYVKAAGGGSVAAKKCAGMPVNSTQGK
jgi:hypothetical protein